MQIGTSVCNLDSETREIQYKMIAIDMFAVLTRNAYKLKRQSFPQQSALRPHMSAQAQQM